MDDDDKEKDNEQQRRKSARTNAGKDNRKNTQTILNYSNSWLEHPLKELVKQCNAMSTLAKSVDEIWRTVK